MVEYLPGSIRAIPDLGTLRAKWHFPVLDAFIVHEKEKYILIGRATSSAEGKICTAMINSEH